MQEREHKMTDLVQQKITEYVQCDLMLASGPNWSKCKPGQLKKLAKNIHESGELLGDEPNLYGFVGTRLRNDLRLGPIVGGYFAVQYNDDEFHYNKNKKLRKIHIYPFARMFFMFFARSGKCLLQNTRFVGLPLTYSEAKADFHIALNNVFEKSGLDKLSMLTFSRDETPAKYFRREYKKSSRVTRLKVTDPAKNRLPKDYIYYNPQIERNKIIRESHLRDYSHLKRIELEVKEDQDLKGMHFGDLMYSEELQEMDYQIGDEKFTLRRNALRKFTFQVDMEAEQLPQKQFQEVINEIRQAAAVV